MPAIDIAAHIENSVAARRGQFSLPTEPEEASACVLSFVQMAHTNFDVATAIKAMTERVEQLRGKGGEQSERELLAHAAITDALFNRFAVAAVKASKPEHQSILGKLALNCQNAYVRTLVAVEGLRQARKGAQAMNG